MSVLDAGEQQASADLAAAMQEVMQRLERAWNSADGAAFAEPFSPGADFVTIRGDLHTGRDAIAAGHQQILATVYAGSTIRYRVLRARELADGVVLVHVRAALSVPAGPFSGEHASTSTLVLVKRCGGWEIAAFQNTLLTE